MWKFILKIYWSVSSILFSLQLAIIIYIDYLLTCIFNKYKGNGNFLSKYLGQIYMKLNCINVIVKNESGINNFNEEPNIFLFNYGSYLDPFLINSFIPTKICFPANDDLWKVPIYKDILNHIEAFKINRVNKEEYIKSNILVNNKIKEKKSIGMASDGRKRIYKSKDFKKINHKFKKGPFKIAKKNEVKILPIIINGSKRIISSNPLFTNYGTIYIRIWKEIPRNELINTNNLDELIKKYEDIYNSEYKFIEDKFIFTFPNFFYNLLFLLINICLFRKFFN